jgi:glycine oxidase
VRSKTRKLDMEKEHYDVLVVGAGVVGCATAYYVVKAGLRVALLDKGRIAGEASQAGAGMLVPLAESDEVSDQHPFAQVCLAGLQFYDGLDQQLKHETGIDIELVDAPTLRPAFDEYETATLRSALERQQHLLPGLKWLEGKAACEVEPLLPPTVQGALLSPLERNVQSPRLTLAYARGAALHGAAIFEGRVVEHCIRQGQRVVGVETKSGPIYAGGVVLAAGAWAATWHASTSRPAIFPVKGQMLALQAPPELRLRHAIYYHRLGYMLPKADGSIYVGATSELAGFDKSVTVAGLTTLLDVVTKLAPRLHRARFERAWAGLRPGSADNLPLLGPSHSMPGLWVAGGHFRNGILLGPLTGHLLAELIQGHPAPFGLDLHPFDPDRFGGWEDSRSFERPGSFIER